MTPSPSRNRGVAETIHENRGPAARYGVPSTPTVVLFKEEAVVDRVVGAAAKPVLQDIVNARA
jgi:thioredoxin-like negative regulator of GroEL